MNNIFTLDSSKCFSCRSCFHSCPQSAIDMRENIEGFLYPEVSNKCIECGICVEKCPVLSPLKNKRFLQTYWCAYLNDEEKLSQSTSGGVFTAFAEKILGDGGIVFGATYDEFLNVKHIFVENKNDLWKLKGSKYVESFTGESFLQVQEFLEQERKVLYSGTPCQIAGLKKYLSKDYDNLFTTDLICHGVPSRKLFRKYLEWLGNRTGGKIIYYGFRDKDIGGWNCGGKAKTKTKTKTIDCICDPYYATFLRGETYRESCYSCPFANTERVGDITIGDFWGVEKFYPEIDKTKGVSCVIVNSEKGNKMLESCMDKISLFESKKEWVVAENGNLNQPTKRPENRSSIYYGIDGGFNNYFKKFKHKNEFLISINRFAGLVLPQSIKRTIKQILWRTK